MFDIPAGTSRGRSIAHAARRQLPALADTGSDEEHLSAAIEWLFRSQDATGGGGSAATYNLLLGWEAPYPETTGYVIPTLYAYADDYPESDASDRATAMAEWLLTVQRDDGSFPEGTGERGDPNVFNTGQAVFGLVEAYRRTGEEAYADAVRAACDWAVVAQDDDGAWRQHDYEGEVHAYATRVAWALLEAASVLDDRAETYRDAARRNLEWALERRRSNGWFENAAFVAGDDPDLHTIAYTIRGLLEGGVRLDDDELVDAARGSADVLLELQRRTGPLSGTYDADWGGTWYRCLTGNAQMGLVWLRLYELTGEAEYAMAARTAAEFLKRHQSLDGPVPVRGAIPGSYPHVGSYLYLRYPNWATKFFADLLAGLAAVSPSEAGGEASEGDEGTATAEATAATGEGTATAETTATKWETATTEAAAVAADAPLRVCLLFDGEHTERWVADAIETMLAETNAEISLVVINEDAGLLGSGNVKRGLKYPAYAAYWLASALRPRRSASERYDDSVHVSEIAQVDDAEGLRTYPTNVSGLWNELPEEVVSEIGARSDVVFRRGFGLVRGSLLSATEHGVLSYHHGDPRAYRGGPAGFWEYMHGEETAGTIVQSLTDDLDAGVVRSYRDVDIADCDTLDEVRRALYEGSTGQLAEAIEAVQDAGREPMVVDDLGPVYHPPDLGELAAYARKRFR
ncbi:formyltransferase family protein [Halorubrum amylolyticum]|uniref:formyltransferase family protein n=1 Tax=Halorubrum amylolyticum TaxID=2508724 RepID=UPI0010091300|nr:formyltransferase family protein [Halorubrum amylolyticum]